MAPGCGPGGSRARHGLWAGSTGCPVCGRGVPVCEWGCRALSRLRGSRAVGSPVSSSPGVPRSGPGGTGLPASGQPWVQVPQSGHGVLVRPQVRGRGSSAWPWGSGGAVGPWVLGPTLPHRAVGTELCWDPREKRAPL